MTSVLAIFATATDAGELAATLPPTTLVRFRHALEDIQSVVGSTRPTMTWCVDLTRSEDELRAGMSPKSTRYLVRRAEKFGSRLRVENDDRAAGDFFRLFNDFRAAKRFGTALRPRRYVRYRACSDVWVAYYDDVAVAGHLVVRDVTTSRVRLIFSASARLERDDLRQVSAAANRYLHWYEWSTYKAAGFATYDFGGVGRDEGAGVDAISRFKMSFGGRAEPGFDGRLVGSLVAPVLSVSNLVASGRARVGMTLGRRG